MENHFKAISEVVLFINREQTSYHRIILIRRIKKKEFFNKPDILYKIKTFIIITITS